MTTSNEYRVFGPPGCGKTTHIGKMIKNALMNYEPDEIAACSFTRAAAEELSGRRTKLPDSNLGTIHSLCYHQLGCPPIVEVEDDLLEEWNEKHPYWQVEGNKSSPHDSEPAQCDELMRYNRYRAQRREATVGVPRGFIEAWEGFKRENDCYDFTDLLEEAPRRLPGIKVLFIDEAQDLTPMQWDLVRQWGTEVDHFTVAGDDDQLLYQFLGAEASAFLTPLPDERKRVLEQSYRVPREVHRVSSRWIQKLGDKRQEKEYEPRDAEGFAEHRGLQLQRPAPLVSEVADHAADGDTVMVLAPCGYQLKPVIKELRKRGIPFHNPYRTKRGDWNPLGKTAKRLLSFLRCADEVLKAPPWQWWDWIEMLHSRKTLQHGAKTEMRKKADAGGLITERELAGWVTEALIEALENHDVEWLHKHATKRFKNALELPRRIYEERGRAALHEDPNVITGTIHSVKGGQADVVYLFPDLSQQAWDNLHGRGRERERAALIRQAYVGMTRAYRGLYLCRGSTRKHWNWN